jgi:hypothetical protein
LGPNVNAITVCIAYSQYLRQCATNRAHFREWVISTVPDDAETFQVAESIGATPVVPKGIQAEGVGFHAGFNKSLWINAGLDELRKRLRKVRNPDARWVAVVDADTLLPVDFADRIAHLLPKLDRRKLYGLAGRRVAETTQEFLALKALGPWEKYLDKAATVIGYFNLFHLDGLRAAYPASDPKRVEHDDGRFYRKFGPKRSAFLPFAALHLGGISMNWSGRREDVQEAESLTASAAGCQLALAKGASTECALVIGLTKPERLAALAGAFRKVVLLEAGPPVSAPDEDLLLKINHAYVRKKVAEVAVDFPNVEWSDGVAYAPSVIVIEAEPTYDLLIDVLAKWCPKLSRNGWICGSHYGYPFFPKTTSAIDLLMSTPDDHTQQGAWAVRWVQPKPRTDSTDFGIALWVFRTSDAEAALVALDALARKWRGPVAVVEWQGETPSLRIACARKGYEYLSIEKEARERGEMAFFDPTTDMLRQANAELAFVAAWYFSPFDETVWVEPSVSLPDLESLRRAGKEKTFAGNTNGTAFVARTRREFQRWWKQTFSKPVSSNGKLTDASKKSLLRLGVPANSASASLELSSPQNERKLLLATKVSVHFPADVSVVTSIETPEDWEAFQRNWSVILWPEGIRRMVVASASVLPASIPNHGSDFVSASKVVSPQTRNEPVWISAMLAASRKYKTRRILYLDPCLNPRPGTQIFRWAADALLASGGWAFLESGGDVFKTAKLGPPATLADRKWFVSAFRNFIRQKTVHSFEVFATNDLRQRGAMPHVEDVMLSGWNL